MTFVKTTLFHKAGEGSGGGGGGGDQHNLGWYATESALTTAHPTANNGDWAIVGATDTVWVWDSDSTAWKDTGAAGIELPDQTGHSGQFLTTNGTDASWGSALVNKATGSGSLNILGDTGAAITATSATSIGFYAAAKKIEATAIGYSANATANYSTSLGAVAAATKNGSIAIGDHTSATGVGAIQLGGSTTGSSVSNSDDNTFKVGNANGNFEIMSADGTIPTARLTKVNTTVTLAVADWSSNTQTVSVTGMTSTGVVLISPDPSDQSAYTSAGILCTAQAADSLTFTCTSTPSANIDVNVVML